MTALLLAITLISQNPTEERPSPVAIVVEVVGKPTRLIAGTVKPIRRLDMLRPGDVVTTGPDQALTIVFSMDGHPEKLSGGVSITIAESGGTDAKGQGKVERLPSDLTEPNLKAFRQKIRGGKIGGGVFRANGPPRPAVAPIDGTAVATTKPAFRWAAVSNASEYRLELLSGAIAGTEKVFWSRTTKSNEMDFPADAEPLSRGARYRWRVSALSAADGVESPVVKESIFLVGPASFESQADSLLKLARKGDSAQQLLAAVTLESLGLLDELYPIYTRLAERAENDPNLWIKASDFAARAGHPQDAIKFKAKADALGWKADSL
jgi:hypothetical protein